ncbi:Glucosamine 6-phosphate N-acetyltransferase [Psidium guajava]|nr:Glucosamine 6-phosphate N-acetyltransferase [Psidium guajava]
MARHNRTLEKRRTVSCTFFRDLLSCPALMHELI